MNEYKDAKAFMEKAAGYGSVLGLSSITELMKQLHNPQDDLRILHVAGTNGKGSTCAFLQSILMEQGYHVGMYTSPAVFGYEERFVFDGTPIDTATLCKYIRIVESSCNQMVDKGLAHPTLFEIETAVAFLYFKDCACDFVILEVGMGGETDATNVISDSVCSVFTSIGRDHVQFLGDSLEKIARIKSGIMKPEGYAVSIWQEETVKHTLLATAHERSVQLAFAEKSEVTIRGEAPLTFSYKEFADLRLSMQGSYQLDNCILALETVIMLRKRGITISEQAVCNGVKKTIWHGRMEKILANPLIYMDGAHNLPAAKRLAETIEKNFTNKTITFIIGVLADKEHREMIKVLLPYGTDILTITPAHPRRMFAEELAREVIACGGNAKACDTMEEAVREAIAKDNHVILAFGSLSYLQEFKTSVLRWAKEHEDV